MGFQTVCNKAMEMKSESLLGLYAKALAKTRLISTFDPIAGRNSFQAFQAALANCNYESR